MSKPNIYILASDNSPSLLPYLRSNPHLASAQDEHGYSLLHAATSWGHIDLLRSLVREFNININMTDEDGDTCLFTAETVDVAKCLVEELGIDKTIKNDEGFTAAEAIINEGSFPEVAAYLMGGETFTPANPLTSRDGQAALPSNMKINFTAESEQELGGAEPDPELRRKIEELASKDTFHTPEGQAELRQLVQEALGRVHTENDERNVKKREE